ncbi:MAG: hypothetical protein ACI841_003223 [Planctomycetota bacterium]
MRPALGSIESLSGASKQLVLTLLHFRESRKPFMNRSSEIALLAILLGGTSFGQQNASSDLETALTPTFSGVYHAVAGVWVYGPATEGLPADDVIFNHTAPSGFFNGGMAAGNTYVDEGRIPSLSSIAPLGTQNSYGVTGVEFSYCTQELEVAGGGAGAHFVIGIVDKFGAGCSGLGDSTPATIFIDVTGAPGSLTPGTLSCHTVMLDLTGLGICISGDGEGTNDGADLFGYSVQFLDSISGSAGAMICGDPNVIGDDTVFTAGGLGEGSGLDAADLFYREADGLEAAACLFFGGYPANPFASHYLKVFGVADGTECANCPNDDRYDAAGNDDCSSATVLNGAGVVENLTANMGNVDYYRVSVPDATVINATAFFSNAQGDLDMRLYNADCTVQLDGSGSVSDNEDVTWTNSSGGALDAVIMVFAWPAGTSNDCADYNLVVGLVDDACGPVNDDGLEDNDDCASAVAAGDGATGLFVSDADSDFYDIAVPAFSTSYMTILFTHADGDLDLFLYDACGGNTLATGFTASDNEEVSFVNNTGSEVTLKLEVDFFLSGCNNYDMIISSQPGQPGTRYCQADENGSGFPAHISATGSASIGENDLVLVAAPVDGPQFGVFFHGPAQDFAPFAGTSHIRCVANPVVRSGVVQASAAGILSIAMDNTGAFGDEVVIGATRYFQAWYRDPAMAEAFNLSDGYCVTFTQ